MPLCLCTFDQIVAMKRLFLLVLLPSLVYGQNWKKHHKKAIVSLPAHVSYLASDKLQGRRAGSEGEKLAAAYMVNAFTTMGIKPAGTDGFLQSFRIDDGKMISPASFFEVNGKSLIPGTDFFPLGYSPDAKRTEALSSVAVSEKGLPWFIDLNEVYEMNRDNPHFDVDAWIRTTASTAASKGSTTLFLYDLSTREEMVYNGKDKSSRTEIPVVYIRRAAFNRVFPDKQSTYDYTFRIETTPAYRTGNNVIAYIDNKASTTVVIGAHYDHLGFGEDGNSMLRTGERLIHNGADDNASGTAGLLVLADLIRKEKLKQHNYLFIAFSAEELGLYGSKYFVENPTIDLGSVNFMINMDMIGRLNDNTRSLTIGGFGTSPVWSKVLTNGIRTPLSFKIDSSGTGPSDHTSFYRKDIPVLFFFTGIHSDYHKPTDDWEKINYEGQWEILKLIYQVLRHPDTKNKLPFTKTREQAMRSSARFSVSLGIMPDYTYSGNGVKVDGVSEGKPAQAAGIKVGDILVDLNGTSVSSVETYMQALSKFKKGETVSVTIRRGGEDIRFTITF
jgi:aminopeptidase YwaD